MFALLQVARGGLISSLILVGFGFNFFVGGRILD